MSARRTGISGITAGRTRNCGCMASEDNSTGKERVLYLPPALGGMMRAYFGVRRKDVRQWITSFAAIVLLPSGADVWAQQSAAQTPTGAAGVSQNTRQTETDEYTRYE